MNHLNALRELMRRLRAPMGGCPWDRAQTFISVVPHTLEEAYEVVDLIETGQFKQLPKELGDLLFQIIFYCELGSEAGLFDFDDVVAALEDKLVRRHPHVFADEGAVDIASVSAQWEATKARERAAGSMRSSSELDDIPRALPALTRAVKLQKRAARVGFDWPNVDGAIDKLDEEITEFKRALTQGVDTAVAEELGDVLFSTVNVIRHLDHDPEALLRAANAKFERRFRAVERRLAEQGLDFASADAARLDTLWNAVKLETG